MGIRVVAVERLVDHPGAILPHRVRKPKRQFLSFFLFFSLYDSGVHSDVASLIYEEKCVNSFCFPHHVG